jgi:quercetin dioxygenase-like cupin family protein
MSEMTPIVRAADEGEKRWWYGGGIHTWKATAKETGGAFMLFEDQMTQGKSTPMHRHPDVDETLYILEGEIVVHFGGQERRVGPGGTVVAPRGVPHAFAVTSPEARMLCLQTPGGGEVFFRNASEPTTRTDPDGPVDFTRVRESATQTGATEILGPPPFETT